MRDSLDRKHIRSIVRVVHPDLFTKHPDERHANSESLKVLSNTVEQLQAGLPIEPVLLHFFAQSGDEQPFKEVCVHIEDSLAPLFEAFGLITAAEAEQGRNRDTEGKRRVASQKDVSLLEWLKTCAQKAAMTSDEMQSLKQMAAETTAGILSEFQLARLEYGSQRYRARSPHELRCQIDALLALEAALHQEPDALRLYAGLHFRIFHPEIAPSKTYTWADPDTGMLRSHTTTKWASVGESGEIQAVACPSSIAKQLAALDLQRGRMLTQVNRHWSTRQKALATAVTPMLRVRSVWRDSTQEISGEEQFCLWADVMLSNRQMFEDELQTCDFSFSVLVHSDAAAPLLEYLSACNVLQVRTDCSPQQLLHHLVTLAAELDEEHVEQSKQTRCVEEELLLQVREVLGAKHLVRVCSQDRMPAVTDALQRLLSHASELRAMVDFSGVSLAIDDHYHLWDSGFVSIPFDFEIGTMGEKLRGLLGSPAVAPAEAAPAAAGGDDDVLFASAPLVEEALPADIWMGGAPAAEVVESHGVEPHHDVLHTICLDANSSEMKANSIKTFVAAVAPEQQIDWVPSEELVETHTMEHRGMQTTETLVEAATSEIEAYKAETKVTAVEQHASTRVSLEAITEAHALEVLAAQALASQVDEEVDMEEDEGPRALEPQMCVHAYEIIMDASEATSTSKKLFVGVHLSELLAASHPSRLQSALASEPRVDALPATREAAVQPSPVAEAELVASLVPTEMLKSLPADDVVMTPTASMLEGLSGHVLAAVHSENEHAGRGGALAHDSSSSGACGPSSRVARKALHRLDHMLLRSTSIQTMFTDQKVISTPRQHDSSSRRSARPALTDTLALLDSASSAIMRYAVDTLDAQHAAHYRAQLGGFGSPQGGVHMQDGDSAGGIPSLHISELAFDGDESEPLYGITDCVPPMAAHGGDDDEALGHLFPPPPATHADTVPGAEEHLVGAEDPLAVWLESTVNGEGSPMLVTHPELHVVITYAVPQDVPLPVAVSEHAASGASTADFLPVAAMVHARMPASNALVSVSRGDVSLRSHVHFKRASLPAYPLKRLSHLPFPYLPKSAAAGPSSASAEETAHGPEQRPLEDAAPITDAPNLLLPAAASQGTPETAKYALANNVVPFLDSIDRLETRVHLFGTDDGAHQHLDAPESSPFWRRHNSPVQAFLHSTVEDPSSHDFARRERMLSLQWRHGSQLQPQTSMVAVNSPVSTESPSSRCAQSERAPSARAALARDNQFVAPSGDGNVALPFGSHSESYQAFESAFRLGHMMGRLPSEPHTPRQFGMPLVSRQTRVVADRRKAFSPREQHELVSGTPDSSLSHYSDDESLVEAFEFYLVESLLPGEGDAEEELAWRKPAATAGEMQELARLAAEEHCLDQYIRNGGTFSGTGTCFSGRKASVAAAFSTPSQRMGNAKWPSLPNSRRPAPPRLPVTPQQPNARAPRLLV